MKIRDFFAGILGLAIAVVVSFLLFEITIKLSGDKIVSAGAAVIGFWTFFDLLID